MLVEVSADVDRAAPEVHYDLLIPFPCGVDRPGGSSSMGAVYAKARQHVVRGTFWEVAGSCGMTESFGVCFGRLVREKRRGWTQEYLAEQIWCDPSRKSLISDLERGKIDNPQQKTRAALIEVLGIKPEEIAACEAKGKAYEEERLRRAQEHEAASVKSTPSSPLAEATETGTASGTEPDASPRALDEPSSMASPPAPTPVVASRALAPSPEEAFESGTVLEAGPPGPPAASMQLLVSAAASAPSAMGNPSRWRNETWRLVLAAIGVILSALALTLSRGDRIFNSVASQGNIAGSTITIDAPASPEH